MEHAKDFRNEKHDYKKQTRFMYDNPWLANFILQKGYPVVEINRSKDRGNNMYVIFEYDYETHCKLFHEWKDLRDKTLGYN